MLLGCMFHYAVAAKTWRIMNPFQENTYERRANESDRVTTWPSTSTSLMQLWNMRKNWSDNVNNQATWSERMQSLQRKLGNSSRWLLRGDKWSVKRYAPKKREGEKSCTHCTPSAQIDNHDCTDSRRLLLPRRVGNCVAWSMFTNVCKFTTIGTLVWSDGLANACTIWCLGYLRGVVIVVLRCIRGELYIECDLMAMSYIQGNIFFKLPYFLESKIAASYSGVPRSIYVSLTWIIFATLF